VGAGAMSFSQHAISSNKYCLLMIGKHFGGYGISLSEGQKLWWDTSNLAVVKNNCFVYLRNIF
jgi:hypothetical protein